MSRSPLQWFVRVLRWQGDIKAIEHGRLPQRIWNRQVSKTLRRVGRKLYR